MTDWRWLSRFLNRGKWSLLVKYLPEDSPKHPWLAVTGEEEDEGYRVSGCGNTPEEAVEALTSRLADLVKAGAPPR